MAQEKRSFPIDFSNQQYVLELLEEYQRSPETIPADWRAFFQGMEFTGGAKETVGGEDVLSFRVRMALDSYRKLGHLEAQHNPMGTSQKIQTLSIEGLGFQEGELSQLVSTFGIVKEGRASLGEVLKHLQASFTGTLSFEYDHIENKTIRDFLDKEVLTPFSLQKEDFRFVGEELYRAKKFEDFLQKKFLGAKRFSLEGCEMFIPILKELFSLAAESSIKNAVIGMAHRGRLNVLCNALGKPYSILMQEFNGKILPAEGEGLGDVKYHKGYVADVGTRNQKKLQVTLASNPSHLESVDPVVLGIVRAKSKIAKKAGSVLPILIHGDASVAGQGVVYETLQMNALEGYGVRGTIHIVINNQVGFTTTPDEGRSTRYCTDIAKAFGMPIMHVNAEDPVAGLRAIRIAFMLRQQFGIDVFIDLNCHRFWGHNETDEPMFTNPSLYKKIKSKESIYREFSQKLISDGVFTSEALQTMEKHFDDALEKAYQQKDLPYEEKHTSPSFQEKKGEKLSSDYLQKIGIRAASIPEAFPAHPKVLKVFENRKEVLVKGENIDWATAEMLAYATILDQGTAIRISGQDVRRGTFSHRHAGVYSQEKEEIYIPLAHLNPDKAEFEIYNSLLSEFGAMGYEFGYTLGQPEALVIWEAQYGDFVNGAQVIIDQYLAGSETKWASISNLTLFLPHGFEGSGPEHSSCRFERFLQLAGLDNWRVVYPTTPAQFFHLLRRQAFSAQKKPLIVVTPKSMLRLGASFSKLSDFVSDSFQEILCDNLEKSPGKRVILCTGKIYYELKKQSEQPIIRLEELYPFPKKLKTVINGLHQAKEFVWVQEEPSNQGAWEYLQPQLEEIIGARAPLRYIGRPRSSIPDTGYPALFEREQKRIIEEATHGEN